MPRVTSRAQTPHNLQNLTKAKSQLCPRVTYRAETQCGSKNLKKDEFSLSSQVTSRAHNSAAGVVLFPDYKVHSFRGCQHTTPSPLLQFLLTCILSVLNKGAFELSKLVGVAEMKMKIHLH